MPVIKPDEQGNIELLDSAGYYIIAVCIDTPDANTGTLVYNGRNRLKLKQNNKSPFRHKGTFIVYEPKRTYIIPSGISTAKSSAFTAASPPTNIFCVRGFASGTRNAARKNGI